MNTVQEILRGLAKLFTWMVICAPWEQVVRVRLGKKVELLRAGVHLRIPFADIVYRQTTRRRMGVVRPQTITTSDGHTVTISGALGYSIVDLLKLYNTVEHAQDTIDSEVAAAISSFIGSHELALCTAKGIEGHVSKSIDLSKYGLGEQEFCVVSFARVKTYRFITGDLPAYTYGESLKTERERTPQ